jgi:3-deoxy-D-manno-octulosonic-acid transferase
MKISLLNLALVLLYRALMVFLYVVARIIGLVYRGEGFQERLGYYSQKELDHLTDGPRVWLHAASAGEVKAIQPFCKALRRAVPGVQIIVTTTSNTGKRLVREHESADLVFLAPLDMGACVRRVLQSLKPAVYLVAETEFWPNALRLVSRSGIPVILINGRISNRSFPSYLRLKALFYPALSGFTHCFVQSLGDQDKLMALGVAPEKITIAGQLKYDLSPPDGMAVQKFKESLSLLRKDIIFTFGSLRTGEDDLLLPIVPQLLDFSPAVRVLLAPRHLKNIQVLQDKLAKIGVASTLRSRMQEETVPERVVLLDTMGELAVSYAFSRAAFVGGTLVPIGGHNLMEPALATVPVCFGPYTSNVMEAAEALLRSGGGIQVRSAPELVQAFQQFMDEDYAQQAGKKAHESVVSMKGATDKTVQGVLKWWSVKS